MNVTIRKIGNSEGIIIPKEVLNRLGLKAGDTTLAIAAAIEEEGVITRPIGESICFCPPLIITVEQLDELFAGVKRGLDKVAAARG